MFSGFKSLDYQPQIRRSPQTDIPVDNIVFVKVLECENQFGDIESSSILTESSLLLQMPEKLSSAFIVGDEIELLLGLEREFETNKERAFQTSLQDLSFSDRMSDFLLGDNFPLGQDLHGIDTASILLSHLENTAECTPTNEFEKFEIGWLEMDFVLMISIHAAHTVQLLTRMAV
jgi:hypothetical protein